MAKAISNSQDIIDSRDVIARIEELESERTDIEGQPDNADTLAAWDEDYGTELKALTALADEAEGYAADWQHGEALIRDSYFQEYAQQLAEDIGAIDNNAKWPNTCINWDEAASELQQDYTSVTFDGVDYWIR